MPSYEINLTVTTAARFLQPQIPFQQTVINAQREFCSEKYFDVTQYFVSIFIRRICYTYILKGEMRHRGARYVSGEIEPVISKISPCSLADGQSLIDRRLLSDVNRKSPRVDSILLIHRVFFSRATRSQRMNNSATLVEKIMNFSARCKSAKSEYFRIYI